MQKYLSLNIPIGEHLLQINTTETKHYQLLKDEYHHFNTHKQPLWRLFLYSHSYIQSKTDFEKRNAYFYFPTNEKIYPSLSNTILSYISDLFLPENYLFLHASAILKNNKAIVFSGPTGTGKSTIAQLPSRPIIADDVAVIRKEGDKFVIYMSPFDKKVIKHYQNKKYEIDKIYFINHAEKNSVVSLPVYQTFRYLCYNTFTGLILENQIKMNKFKYRLMFDLLAKIPMYRLNFNLQKEFIAKL